MKDELLVRKEKWEVVVYVNALIDEVFTGSFKVFERFFDLLFLCKKFFQLGCYPGLFFCHANAKLPPKHWTSIVIEYMANSRL